MSEKVGCINPAKDNGRTVLDFAAMNGKLGICKFIIENSADKNPKDIDDVSTLHLAARYGHLEVCKLIFDHVSDKNPNCSLGWTPFHEAAFGGSLELGRWNWNLHYIPFRRFKIDREKPLDVATPNSYLQICKLIIESISDKNPSGPMGFTALHVAADAGQFEICELIMENVLDKNPEDQMGQTPFHFFARHGHLEICELVIQTLVDKNPHCQLANTPLHEAARGGHLEVCRLIIEGLADINPVNTYGETPLHNSVQSGNIQLCKLMVDYAGDVMAGPSIYFMDGPGVTVKESLVKLACQEGDLEMCKFLVDNEENCKLNPISRTLFMALMMCLYFFAGTGFSETWPKHSLAALFLFMLVQISLLSPYLLVFTGLVKFFEMFESNNVHENSVGYILIRTFILPLLAVIFAAFNGIIIVPKFQSCLKYMKGL